MIRDVGSVNNPTSTDAFRWNDWSFWGGSVDQGLLWYEFFVRKGSGAHAGKRAAAGIYSRWSTAHKVTHRMGRGWQAMGSHGWWTTAKASPSQSKQRRRIGRE